MIQIIRLTLLSIPRKQAIYKKMIFMNLLFQSVIKIVYIAGLTSSLNSFH